MIKYIPVKGTCKSNWPDDRGVLVGFDDEQLCCEEFREGVYEKESGKQVSRDPDGLPYHFAKTYKANGKRAYCGGDPANLFQVDMFPDDDESTILVFECFNDHNGYYYHDFDMKVDFKES